LGIKFDLEKESVSMGYHHTLAALALTGAVLFGPANKAGAVPVSPGLSRIDGPSVIELVQDRPKSETVKQKVK
jgi:hypothetical protein